MAGTSPLDAGFDAPTLPLLDPSFVPVSAIVCGARPQVRPDGGTDLVATEEHGTDVAGLAAVLRLPVLPPGDGACRADLPSVGWLAVVDAGGRWVRPGPPTDECGRIRDEVTEVVRTLPLTTVSTRALRELQSAAAAQAGCPQEATDMVWHETTLGGEVPAAAVAMDPFAGDVAVRLCAYEMPAAERGGDKPGGTFVRGGVLGTDLRAEMTRLLLAAGPAADCAVPSGRFALLSAAEGTNWTEVQVELDGCRRVLVQSALTSEVLAQAGPELAELLSQE